ncbi:MAG: HAMP domain-containing sensor histidine kinase [Candidatus Eisenbacteria bacterium]
MSGISALALSGGLAGAKQLLEWGLLAWFAANLLSEFLWLEAESGEVTDSMALTMNLGVILLLEPTQAIWIVALSVFIATRFIQKRDWVKSLFGLGQMAITCGVSSYVFQVLHPDPVLSSAFGTTQSVGATVVCAATYFLTNTFLVAGAVALQTDTGLWQVWRANWGTRNNIVSSVALFSLTPLMIIAFSSLGFSGVLLFFLPLLIVKNQNRDYIQLKRMTEEKVQREKLVEAGRIARAIGHEIRNFLGVILGRVQLMDRHVERMGDEKLRSDLRQIREQIDNLADLSKQIMESTERGVRPQSTDLNRFLLQQVEMLRPYPTLEGVEIVPELSPDAGMAEFDRAQIRQVVVNLIKNAAEAMRDADPKVDAPVVTVRSFAVGRDRVRIEVEDNGPGIPPSLQEKVFDLLFTTKKYGHGFGLATCRAILLKHRGRIELLSEPGRGATFVLEIPRTHPETNEGSSDPTVVTRGAA